MPAVTKDVNYILSLFFKCEKYRTLPYPGGVLSQPAWIMNLFDTITSLRDDIRAESEAAATAHRELENHV